jgi:hypothetical protein
VIVATVMHGAANIATPILLPGVDREVVLLVTGAIYALVAVALVVRSGAYRPADGHLARRLRTHATV